MKTTFFMLMILCTAGCSQQPKVKVVDLAAAQLPASAKVHVDGKVYDEDVWNTAAVMAFEKTGEARFLWNNRKLYGFIQKYEHQKFGFDFDEQICVSIRTGSKIAKLFFEEQRSREAPSTLALRAAWVLDSEGEAQTKQAIPRSSLDVASLPSPACRGFSWSVEFSLDWHLISNISPPNEATSIVVYRLIPKRPVTHAVRMKGTGIVGEGQ